MGKHRLSRRDGEQWGGPELANGSEPTRHAAAVGERAEAPLSPAAEDGGDPAAVPTGRPPSG